MSGIRRLWMGMSVAALMSALMTVQAVAGGWSLMVIPARQRVVELGFDVARMRNVGLVSYQTDAKTGQTLLHYWNGGEWVRLSSEDFLAGSFFEKQPDLLIRVGSQQTLPGIVAAVPSWCGKAEDVDSMAIADMVNSLGNFLKFRPAEWQWLSEKYGLKLSDQNAERRRWGRYGPPGSTPRKPEPQAAGEAVSGLPESLPPVPVVEEPVMPSK